MDSNKIRPNFRGTIYDTTATHDEYVPETFTGKEGWLPRGLSN